MTEFILIFTFIIASPGPVTMLIVRNSIAGSNAIFSMYVGLLLATSIHAVIGWSSLELLTENFSGYEYYWRIAGTVFLLFLVVESVLRYRNFTLGDTVNSLSRNKNYFVTGFLIEFTNPAGLAYYTLFFPRYAGIEFSLVTYITYFLIQIIIIAIVFTLYFSLAQLFIKRPNMQNKLQYIYLFSALVFGFFFTLSVISLITE